MATLADVARLAGVTAATVSNVLSGRVVVREATRQRVLAAIAATGYHPNLLARGLARRQTFTLALLVPSLTNPFFAEVVEALEGYANIQDYQLLLALSHGQPTQAARHLERLASRWVDGFLLMGGAAPMPDVLTLAVTAKPIVLSVWGTEPEADQFPRVEIDFHQAGEMATRHLLDRGHTRIAAILELPVQQTRLEGFRSTLHDAGMSLPAAYVRAGDSSFASGQRAAQELLALPTPPTAIFTGNDAMALGVLAAAEALGIHVPADLAVVGVDDIPAAEYAHPPLTTVRIPTRTLARAMIDRLMHGMAGDMTPTQLLLSPVLVVRQST